MSNLAEKNDIHCRWHVARTRRAAENLAVRHLSQQNFSTFLPTFEKTTRHARKFIKKRAPLFPSYVFVHFDPAHTQWRSINGTLGVAGLLMNGDQPAPTPRGLIEDLMLAYSDPATPPERFAIGDQVRMIGGPFADKVGRLAEIHGAGRVSVLMEFMGQERPVRTRVESLHPAG